ncbi:MAG: hypothetical protein ACRDMX_05275 [Solirubrobacteraceae bacterium]
MLTAVLAHLPAEQVAERVALLRALSPQARFVVCYAGPPSEFERIDGDDKLLIDDPTLRGAEQHLQSLTQTFEALWRRYFEHDAELDSLYLIEYDHLVLSPRFESHLRELAQRTSADLMGKNCVERTATNDEHYIRFRRDPRLLSHLRRLSVREDPTRIAGCLGDGMWLSRRALEAYVEVGEHPPCYCETYVPTLLHHLGLRLVDIDAGGDLYRDVRWVPPYDTAQVLERFSAGAVFIHPVKDRRAVRALHDEVLRSRAARPAAEALHAARRTA